jgi:acyl carrier protein
MDETILQDVKRLLGEVLRDTDGARPIRDDDDIVRGLGLDSLQMIHFLLSVETHFGIALDFEQIDLETLGSVRQFCELVARLRRAPEQP